MVLSPCVTVTLPVGTMPPKPVTTMVSWFGVVVVRSAATLGGAGITVVSDEALSGRKCASPEYVATISFWPGRSVSIDVRAVPVASSGTVARTRPAVLNVTLPVGRLPVSTANAGILAVSTRAEP